MEQLLSVEDLVKGGLIDETQAQSIVKRIEDKINSLEEEKHKLESQLESERNQHQIEQIDQEQSFTDLEKTKESLEQQTAELQQKLNSALEELKQANANVESLQSEKLSLQQDQHRELAASKEKDELLQILEKKNKEIDFLSGTLLLLPIIIIASNYYLFHPNDFTIAFCYYIHF